MSQIPYILAAIDDKINTIVIKIASCIPRLCKPNRPCCFQDDGITGSCTSNSISGYIPAVQRLDLIH